MGLGVGSPPAFAILGGGLLLFIAITALTYEKDHAYSSAMVYLFCGIIIGALLRQVHSQVLDLVQSPELLHRLAEFGLLVAVFAAGLSLGRFPDRGSVRSTVLLLAVVMPVTVGAVTALGVLLLGMPPGAAVLLGAILAPTDPVLAGDVGLGPPGEENPQPPRVALHAEAGLNDGLAGPIFALGLFLLSGKHGWVSTWILADAIYGVVGAAVLGAIIGYLVARLNHWLSERKLADERFEPFVGVATALTVYGAAQVAGTYGLVACFVAGMAYRRRESSSGSDRRLHRGAHVAEQLLELAILLVFGAYLTASIFSVPGWRGWVLVAALVLVIRPVSVLAVLGRRCMGRSARIFVAIVGVRGTASLLYAALAVQSQLLSSADTTLIVWITSAAVVTSVCLFGVAATPLTARLLPENTK